MPAKALAAVETSTAQLDAKLDTLAADVTSATKGVTALKAGAALPDLCAIWSANRGVIQKAADFLKNGSIKILIISIKLPKFLRAVGEFLAALDSFLAKACA